MYCAETDCEKRLKGHCKTPVEPQCEEDASYDMTGRCSCKECVWGMYGLFPVEGAEPCEFVGDPYNIDGDCIATK